MNDSNAPFFETGSKLSLKEKCSNTAPMSTTLRCIYTIYPSVYFTGNGH